MEKMLRNLIVVLLVLLAQAMDCHADTFKGKVVNAETGEPLVGASIKSEVNPQPGWSMQNSAETDSTGCFYLDNGWEGRIMFTVSMIGFRNTRKVDYSYGQEVNDTTDLGTIKLQPTALMLQNVEVTAKLPRITMRGDTIVFNPEAFKLKEGARLDELIRKLPGVQHRDGKLYWNDKPIRLMMNGKNMFDGDAIVGQLPAEVANKIKLYNRKSELARHTGNDDGEEDHVLDIQVKPGFLDKWYGEVNAGYQTKDRYSANITASRLSDHDPQMVYGQANTVNRYIDREISSTSNRNVDQDGRSQYGSYNYQHNWSTKGADKYDNNRFDVSANMGHSDGWGTTNQTTETFFPGNDRTFALARTKNYDHRLVPQLSAKLYAYADSVNLVSFKATAKFQKTHGYVEDGAASYSYDPDKFVYHTLDEAMSAKSGDELYDRLITRNRNYTSTDAEQRSLTLEYSWKHFMKNKGSFSLNGYTVLSGNDSERRANRKLEYLREGRTEALWQYADRPTREQTTALWATIDRWITRKWYVNVTDRVIYTHSTDKLNFFADTDESHVHDGTPTTRDAANTMDKSYRSWGNLVSINSTILPTKNFMIMPKLSWNMSHENLDLRYGQLDTTAVRTNHSFEPSLMLKWKISRERSMDLSFAYNTYVPDYTNSMDYRDTTNPMQVMMGNPLLRNSHSHVTSYNYHRMWLRKQIVLALGATYTKEINPIGYLYHYNSATGVYEYMPTNVKGGDKLRFDVNYDQGINAYLRVMNQARVIWQKSYGYLTLVDNPNGTPQVNRQKRFCLYDNFEFSYEDEKVRLTAYNRITLNRYRYTDASYNNTPLDDEFGVHSYFKLSPFNVYIDVSDNFRSGYQTSSMNRHRLICNGKVDYNFFKNKCQLSLMVNDLFNKDIYYDVNFLAYQRIEKSEEYIHHYLNVTFTYRFDAKAKKNKK